MPLALTLNTQGTGTNYTTVTGVRCSGVEIQAPSTGIEVRVNGVTVQNVPANDRYTVRVRGGIGFNLASAVSFRRTDQSGTQIGVRCVILH
jgi:hypothetical protein